MIAPCWIGISKSRKRTAKNPKTSGDAGLWRNLSLGTRIVMSNLLARPMHALLAMSCLGTVFCIPSVFGTGTTEPTNASAAVTNGQPADEAVTVDLAKLTLGGRIVYVSSGAKALVTEMIDNDLRTASRFANSDLQPTVIVELARSDQIHRVDAVYTSESVKLDVYLLNELPKNPGDFRALTPIGSIVDVANRGEATLDFAPRSARYVALRWTRQGPGREPFHVTEVSVFAAVARDQVPPVFDVPDLHIAGESAVDLSNKLGTLADPPKVASVSP
jgi:hypothetical protein